MRRFKVLVSDGYPCYRTAEDGDVCLWEDVEKLIAERDELVGKLAIWKSSVEDVYWPKHDGTREWCSELSTYLRGAVHFVGVLEVEEAERLGLEEE